MKDDRWEFPEMIQIWPETLRSRRNSPNRQQGPRPPSLWAGVLRYSRFRPHPDSPFTLRSDCEYAFSPVKKLTGAMLLQCHPSLPLRSSLFSSVSYLPVDSLHRVQRYFPPVVDMAMRDAKPRVGPE